MVGALVRGNRRCPRARTSRASDGVREHVPDCERHAVLGPLGITADGIVDDRFPSRASSNTAPVIAWSRPFEDRDGAFSRRVESVHA